MKYLFLLNSFSLKNKYNDVYNRIEKFAKRRELDYVIESNSNDVSTEDII